METNKEELLQETIQEITLAAWPIIYGESNPFDLDSRTVLSLIRDWAREFEKQWNEQPDDPDRDYLIAVQQFAEKKAKEEISSEMEDYLAKLGIHGERDLGEAADGTGLDMRVRQQIDTGRIIDLRGSFDESTVLCIQGDTVPRDFYVDSVIRSTGGVILYGYWADPETDDETWDALLLADIKYYPCHSDNLVEAIQDVVYLLDEPVQANLAETAGREDTSATIHPDRQ